ncbi:MAG TPA: hypothetical protein ENJ46_05705, partial [Hellea balneolensis]|nr:hypothetical protein [Hellea balneolensis]
MSNSVIQAQETPHSDTPRERVIGDVLPQAAQPLAAIVPLEAKKIAAKIPKKSQKPDQALHSDKSFQNEQLAPFYVNGAEYLDIRYKNPEQGAQDVLVLDYKLS